MPVPPTLNKCPPATVPPPPRYRAPKRHFLPAPLVRQPPQSSTLPSSPAQERRAPSRLETEPLISLLFQSEGRSPIRPPLLRPNRLVTPTRTERIMLRRPSPSPRNPRQRRTHLRRLFRFPRDLNLVTSLGLIALVAVCSLALIQIGNATARKTCPPFGGRSRPSTDTTQHITDSTQAGSVSQGLQKPPP